MITIDREAIAKWSKAARLARAVLLFHRGGPWMQADHEMWHALTGHVLCTSRNLCDFARAIVAEEHPNGTEDQSPE